jgi:tubulin epsilon
MRETITVQVGQCGNQIGNQFWTQMLQEHESTPDTDDALSSFFRFSPQKDGRTHAMKARALLIDMECGPLQETMRSPLGSLFDDTQFVMDVYGAGNNFAHGHFEYGPQYRNKFEEGLRKNAEHCDSLQTFIVTHSLSGGTGSGVGTYVLGLLHDLYPEIYRFSACVFPSEDNDVVTAPYNSVLATKQLIEHADCIFPIDNRDLQTFAALEASQRSKKSVASKGVRAPMGIGVQDPLQKARKDKGFDDMNAVAARMLCHLTSSSRFHGEMNVDLNEICTNLIPFPRLQFLMTALSPQRASASGSVNPSAFNGSSGSSASGSSSSRNSMQRAFSDLLSRNGQINGADPMSAGCVTVASAFISRGTPSHVRLSDFLSCVTNAQKSLRFPDWNRDACKVRRTDCCLLAYNFSLTRFICHELCLGRSNTEISSSSLFDIQIGMCNTPAPGGDMSVLGVYNRCAIWYNLLICYFPFQCNAQSSFSYFLISQTVLLSVKL